MVEYNEDYESSAIADDTSDGWKTSSRGEYDVGITPEFDGEFEGPAPENFYVIALTNCYIATFKKMASNSGLSFDNITADGTLRLRPSDGTTVVDSFELNVELTVSEKTNKTGIILERTSEYCFILKSVSFDINISYNIIETT